VANHRSKQRPIPDEAPELTVPLDEAQERVMTQITAGDVLVNRRVASHDDVDQLDRDLTRWKDYTGEVLRRIASTDSLANDFNRIRHPAYVTDLKPTVEQRWRPVNDVINLYLNNVRSIYDRLDLIPVANDAQSSAQPDPLPTILNVLDRFHAVAKRLRRRHNNRETLDVRDEYDVQDLLNALLLVSFDDVRAEEGSPSVAGSSPRIDFLLKSERTLIEVKMTRSGLTDKKLGDELSVDLQRYRSHPDYDTLIFFIYDPADFIRQPASIINDLSGAHNGKRVIVVIEPG